MRFASLRPERDGDDEGGGENFGMTVPNPRSKREVATVNEWLIEREKGGQRAKRVPNHGGRSAAQSWNHPGGAHYDWAPDGV